jgi:preprotein translocase subunit YajC
LFCLFFIGNHFFGQLRLPFACAFLHCPAYFQTMHLNTIFADAIAAPTATPAATIGTQTPPPGLQGLLNSPLPMIVLFGVMIYFVMIRPQSQQRKKQAALLNALKAGDKVATASGIVGTVITVKDNTVSLRSADAKMEVTKASVTQILESISATEVKTS